MKKPWPTNVSDLRPDLQRECETMIRDRSPEDFARLYENADFGPRLAPDRILYRDGEPCSHPGCASHQRSSCEYCGRIRCQGDVMAILGR